MGTLCRIVTEPVDLLEAVAAISGPDRGALATFCGTVRDHHRGRRVLRLEYQAYAPMAERVFAEIAAEAEERFAPARVGVVHRIGVLEIGEISVAVAVGAAHRREALAACAFVIDAVKRRAPIWKKEYLVEGVVWIEGPERRDDADA